jgi:Ca2+/Na+ antiporter
MLVVGTAALIRPIKVTNETVKKQLPLHLITIIIFAITFIIGNGITRIDGIILFGTFICFIIYISGFIKT